MIKRGLHKRLLVVCNAHRSVMHDCRDVLEDGFLEDETDFNRVTSLKIVLDIRAYLAGSKRSIRSIVRD